MNVSFRNVIVLAIMSIAFSDPPAIFHSAKPVSVDVGITEEVSNYFLHRGILTKELVDSLGRNLIDEHSGQLHVTSREIQPVRIEWDSVWWIVDYKQALNGVGVYGTEVGLTIGKHGTVISFGGHVFPNVKCTTSPTLTSSRAMEIVVRDSGHKEYKVYEEPKLAIVSEQRDSIVYHLVWQTFVSSGSGSFRYFVSADDGTIFWKEDMTRQ